MAYESKANSMFEAKTTKRTKDVARKLYGIAKFKKDAVKAVRAVKEKPGEGVC